jgi:hypothetical protein
MPGRAKQPGFVQWGERFFAYLVKEKGGTNPALMELIYNLGDDGRQELALSIYNFLRPESWKRFGKGRQQAGQQARKGLSNAIRDLRRAAASHRKLLTLVPEIGTGTLLGAGAPFCLPDFLEMEATRLALQSERAPIVFSKKRGGTKENHAILFRLQEFVEEFGRRWTDYLPPTAARHLTASAIADLLEAGKSALGWPESPTITDPESIDKALRRFREHKDNALICELLRADAIQACDRLRLRAPVPAS